MLVALGVLGWSLYTLLLGESPRPYHAAGIGLVLAGVWLATGRAFR